MNSKKNSIGLPKWIEFDPFIKIPKLICATPKITDNFIFIELKKVKAFEPKYHFGSNPRGYTQSSINSTSCKWPSSL